MSNSERFLNAFASIEKEMSAMVRETRYVPFSQLLTRCAGASRIVRANEDNLREYSELRNAIVHERGPQNEVIAEPCDGVTEDIERIAFLLSEHRDILSFATSPVHTVNSGTDIEAVYELMKEIGTSKLPVYDEGIYKGIATMEEIAGWGFSDHRTHDIGSILKSSRNDKVLFLSRSSSVETAARAFESALDHGSTLLAVLITEKGTIKGRPLGIITVADLPKILKSFA